jgi:hypothetical protein
VQALSEKTKVTSGEKCKPSSKITELNEFDLYVMRQTIQKNETFLQP